MKSIIMTWCSGFAVFLFSTSGNTAESFRVEEATISAIHEAFQNRSLTCRALVQTYLNRIAAYDHNGPALNAILTINLNALTDADARDVDFERSGLTGTLHCIPLILKDNFDTADMPTTGGSSSLAGAQPKSDAFVVAELRRAGAIILGKANMHEFARAGMTVSSLGGQTRNPYGLTRTPGGSSGGT